jgi:hypothetical protein
MHPNHLKTLIDETDRSGADLTSGGHWLLTEDARAVAGRVSRSPGR